jgi:hypothetical protein
VDFVLFQPAVLTAGGSLARAPEFVKVHQSTDLRISGGDFIG